MNRDALLKLSRDDLIALVLAQAEVVANPTIQVDGDHEEVCGIYAATA